MLTTAQLVEAYGTDTDTIKRNKDSYTEGKHFYLLTGENLKRFMGDNLSLTISNMTRTLLPLDRNREHYQEGKHFYCLENDELRIAKNDSRISGIAKTKTINKLYLWTEKGAFLHAKSMGRI